MSISHGLLAHRDPTKVGDALQANTGETAANHAAWLLAAHPERDWRLRDLAGLVHLSTSQLGRIFIRDLGVTPMQYLARVRAHRLAQLLVETDLPIGIAMVQVGWHSRGHAARQFTAIIGASPSGYRRKAAGLEPATVHKTSHPHFGSEEDPGWITVCPDSLDDNQKLVSWDDTAMAYNRTTTCPR